jgi:hypothetical protein
LRRSQDLEALRTEIAGDFDREPDKTIAMMFNFLVEGEGMKASGRAVHGGHHGH